MSGHRHVGACTYYDGERFTGSQMNVQCKEFLAPLDCIKEWKSGCQLAFTSLSGIQTTALGGSSHIIATKACGAVRGERTLIALTFAASYLQRQT